jgi:branched-chain amino acid transport system substrate-binding protein
MVHALYLVEVKKPEESKAPCYQVLQTIPGDEAFPRIEDEDSAN